MPRVKRSTGVVARLRSLNRLLKSKRPKSQLETLCIQRQITDLERERKNGLIWNEEEARRAVEFCKLLVHWQGPLSGTSFVPEPWQEELIIAPLFGWYRKADGRRRFTESYIEVPRKNGKTFMAAAIALQGLLADGESGPEVYAAATKKDQARIVFRDSSNAMRNSSVLMRVAKVQKHSILCEANDGFFQPISSDENGLHGLKTSRAVIDELHSHKTRDVYDVMVTSTGARRQPLIVAITTAGHDRTSICWEVHQRAVNVLDGNAALQSFHCFIACADPEDDWQNRDTWFKANPNLGISCTEDKIEEAAATAAATPSAENKFRRLHLNQWTEQSVRWLPLHSWDACATEFEEQELYGQRCYASLDIASTRDINSLTCVFPQEEGRVRSLSWFWAPEESSNQRAAQDRRQLLHWAKEGWIRLTEGNTADVDGQIPEDVHAILSRFQVELLAYDPWGPAPVLIQRLVRMGFPLARCKEFRQTIGNCAGATREFERLILARKFEHDGNPVLRWMAANVVVKTDSAGNMRPDKEKSAEKIDGIVTNIMSIGLQMTQQQAAIPSYYDTHQLEAF